MEKFSRQRESIKENLANRYDHPTADMIYDEVRIIYPNISLGTVYRNLSLLVDKGEIIKISTMNGPDRFDGHIEPHYHFCCERCSKVYDIKMDDIIDIKALNKKKLPGKITSYSIMFNGLCNECK